MRNIKVILEYEGTNYSGWQIQGRQKRKKTIQEILEKALSQILQEKIKIIGSGRTDAGVHALAQTASFKTGSQLPGENIRKGANTILPSDIRIKQAEDTKTDFHARFSAQSKLYRYTIVNNSVISPFLRRYAYLVRYPLNLQRIRRAAGYFLGRHDFRSFRAADRKERHSVRKIKRLDVRRNKDIIHIDIEADGFLYRMVRNIVGTLLEIGRGRLEPEDVQAIFKARDRSFAGPCVPARGLTMVQVNYERDF